MEDLQDYLELVNPHWIAIVLSVLCLLAEYKLWPRSLKEPPVQLVYIYEMLVSALITNLATKAVWIPLLRVIYCLTQESSKWLFWVNSTVGLGRYSFLASWAYYMEKEMAAIHVSYCAALLAFVWMLDATEALEAVLDTLMK
ncbi:uncharacterized protein LOC107271203 isoform X2 [Cephus cinctus]|uniref:Uncharacterized protein LOC107271203 isoform X2 n=1 Tax=Cephus cinctus TaxID=211228 RepID=A0AAJ7RNM7_CEPCN|nr:uncharacterized protein LOC107271203 isoform X2 [Cephus cinctus]